MGQGGLPPHPESLSLYLHIPFCLRRCLYCAFPSSVYDPERVNRYLEALAIEIAQRANGLSPRTLYIGGGTPTALSLPELERLFALFRSFGCSSLVEFTIETNPGTLDREKAAFLRSQGVSRVSVGVQTFQEEGLRVLGRIHTVDQSYEAVEILREAGFSEISIDLIFGWPGEKVSLWQDDLDRALRLGLPHLSCYALTYEEGTPLSCAIEEGALGALEEEEERQLFDLAGEILPRAGRPRYEISNFAIPGHECQHNLHYWKGGEYIGLGAGAHSYQGVVRYANEEAIDRYMERMMREGDAVAMVDSLPPEKRARECAVIWLRLTEGIDPHAFQERTGFDLVDLLGDALPPLLSEGWLVWKEGNLCLGAKGLPITDSILAELV